VTPKLSPGLAGGSVADRMGSWRIVVLQARRPPHLRGDRVRDRAARGGMFPTSSCQHDSLQAKDMTSLNGRLRKKVSVGFR
jgi:hypothetical protein